MPMLSWPSRRILAVPAILAVSLFSLAGCDGSTDPIGPVASVNVVLLNPLAGGLVNVPQGATRQLRAVPADANDQLVRTTVTWATSNAGVATVDPTGLVTAVGPGTATISATAAGETGEIDIEVRQRVATIVLAPDDTTIRREGGVLMRPVLLGPTGDTLSAAGRTLQWSSTDTDVAIVRVNGQVIGLTDGPTDIELRVVQAGGEGPDVTESVPLNVLGPPEVATVTVTPANVFRGTGQTVQYTATARSALGTEITGNPITWTSTSGAVATVDGSGLATVITAGTTNIRATIEGVQGQTALNTAQSLSSGVAIALPTITSGGFVEYAVVVPAGQASLVVQTQAQAGATGDADIYVYAPGVVPGAASEGTAGSGFTCRPWLVGSTETCTMNNPAAGTWRVRVHAWFEDPDVTNTTLTATLN